MAIANPKPRPPIPLIERYASSVIPTEYGDMHVIVYRESHSEKEHCAIVAGSVRDEREVLVRIHSECLTGEVFRSLKCDCRDQLDAAMHAIAAAGRGAVLYLRQEGRGIGLGNKIRAYALQEQGHDTVDANRLLGFGDDLRTYEVATLMLEELGIQSVNLLTNNPEKVDALRRDGVAVASRTPTVVRVNAHNREYLETKRVRMGHLIEKKKKNR